MGDIMRPIPFSELVNRVFSELRVEDSVFGIGRRQFFQEREGKGIEVFGRRCATPVGPAAGPHTQLAQNIVAGYLAGGRFIELKTVQIMDELDIAKPCIDSRDEGYNVEWSSEFTLPKACDEYTKAWIVLHLLQALLRGGRIEEDGFVFNMSVGYNLEGIRRPRMQSFIDSLIDARTNPKFAEHMAELGALLAEGGLFDGTPFEGMEGRLGGLAASIDTKICNQVTISTMHGCPPDEIEAICSYMLAEKGLSTFVKLNPTLLGYDAVREILDRTGFGYVGLRRESFEKDLQYSDAVPMLRRLAALAREKGLGFGVKLTNTLGSVNDQGQLPGDEMYMSGRALLPISTRIAALLSKEFDGKLPVSYSGGASAFTVQDLFDTGIRPITVATDLLKPGGYTRLGAMASILLDKSKAWRMDGIDVERLETLALTSVGNECQQKAFRGTDRAKIPGKLPMFDCFEAPCVQACPIHQNIPDYVSLVGEGRYAEALEVIYEDNALPNITCNICDHQCQYHCSRMDYEGAVRIRDMKKAAVEKGGPEYYSKFRIEGFPSDVKAAVVGAGPAGLAAAYFLARAGFKVQVMEKEADAGGVVAHVIPGFRISSEAVEADVRHVMAQGAEFRFGCDAADETVSRLREQGFEHIFYAVGCGEENSLPLQGGGPVLGALEFLSAFRKDPASVRLGRSVVVCGGGNTAIDSARAALRAPGVEKVTIVYRRSEAEMPADREEYNLALGEGIGFCFLANPDSFEEGSLLCREMELGEKDASGRRRPVETSRTFSLECDTLVAAIGEKADGGLLGSLGVPVDAKGRPVVDPDTLETPVPGVYAIGDMASGPSTVVRCVASARKAVESAIDKVLGPDDDEDEDGCGCGCHDGSCDEGDDEGDDLFGEEDSCEDDDEEAAESLIKEEEAFFGEIAEKKASHRRSLEPGDPDFEANEARRCLDCPYLCGKCVDVCPNRANVLIDTRGYEELFDDPYQIVHLDAFCNECGNCAVFCPHDGKPYKDKFTLFSRRDDFEGSENDGFFLEFDKLLVRFGGEVRECALGKDGDVVGDIDERARTMIEIIFNDYNYLLGAVEE